MPDVYVQVFPFKAAAMIKTPDKGAKFLDQAKGRLLYYWW